MVNSAATNLQNIIIWIATMIILLTILALIYQESQNRENEKSDPLSSTESAKDESKFEKEALNKATYSQIKRPAKKTKKRKK